MEYLAFLASLKEYDPALVETISAGYKMIFEYQTDMFMSDDEAKKVDEKDELIYSVKEEVDRFDSEMDYRDLGDLKNDLDFIECDPLLFVRALFAKHDVPVEINKLTSGTLVRTTDFYFVFGPENRQNFYVGAGKLSELPGAIAEDPIEFIPIERPDLAEPGEFFNKEFWSYPAPLYHSTDAENLRSILEEGLNVENKTRGISNRSVGHAVFASTEPEATTSYGDAMVCIDTEAMKNDGFMPRVSQEPDVEVYSQVQAIMRYFKIDDRDAPVSIESGMDPETVIIHSSVPAKYLTVEE